MEQKRIERMKNIVKRRRSDLVVALLDIHDPHNAAAIMRTCDALGIQNIHLIFEKEKSYDPRRIGKTSSSSANKWLNFTLHTSVTSCFEILKHNGFTIVATALTQKSEPLDTVTFPEEKIALLVGNEHEGLSSDAIKLADRTILIPMHGFVQSLNVSVATAITLWDITQKRNTSPMNAQDQQKLLEDFLQR